MNWFKLGNKINAHSLLQFQDTEANSDIKHEQNSEKEDITNVHIVPCEVTSHLICNWVNSLF